MKAILFGLQNGDLLVCIVLCCIVLYLLRQNVLFCHLAVLYVPYLVPKDLSWGHLT